MRWDEPGSSSVIEIEQSLTATRNAIPSLRANFAWTFAGNVLYWKRANGACCRRWQSWAMHRSWDSLRLAWLFPRRCFSSPACNCGLCRPRMLVRSADLPTVLRCACWRRCSDWASSLLLCLSATGSTSVRTIVLLISVSKGIEGMSDVIAGLLQRAERLDRVAISLTPARHRLGARLFLHVRLLS